MGTNKNEIATRLTIKDILKGIDGISKAMVGMDKVDEETYKKRKNICVTCDKIKMKNGDFKSSKCSMCKCWLRYKIKLNKEKCPLNYW